MNDLETFIARLTPRKDIVLAQISELHADGYITFAQARKLAMRHTSVVRVERRKHGQ